MVRFGSYLQAQRLEEWKDEYLDYEGLDEMIQALAEVENASLNVDIGKSGYGERVTSLSMMPNPSIQAKFRGKDITEADFFSKLEAEMNKIDEFTHTELSKVRGKIDALVEKASEAEKLSEQERQKSMDSAKKLGDQFLKIEKFANLNYLGFHKILKKHDKQLPATPCRKFYLTRLHQQRWIRHDYSGVFVNLSKIYSLLRGDIQRGGAAAKSANVLHPTLKRSTQMFWVRVEDISKVKHIILQHLPVFQEDLNPSNHDSQMVTSVYFDNTQLELYHRRLDKGPGAFEIRFRWFGTDEPTMVYVERRNFFEGWNSDVSVKDRFSLKPDQVMPFIRGEFTVEDKVKEMTETNESKEDIENTRALFTEIYDQLDSKVLEPRLRTVYNRVAYQIPSDDSVRLCLDTGVFMHLESPREGPDVLSRNTWYRGSGEHIPPSEITHFPHAVLEIKLALKQGDEPPIWLSDLINSGLVTLVHKFSKYLHGCAALLHDDVQVLPFWIDDESIQASIVKAQAPKERLFANDDEGELRTSNGKVRFDPAIESSSGIHLMKPRKSVMDGKKDKGKVQPKSYGTMPAVSAPHEGSLITSTSDEWSWLQWMTCGLWSHSGGYSKIPLKVEPKQFLANERTYLNWLGMAVTLGSIAAGLLGFTGSSEHQGTKLAHMVGMILLPVAMCFCAYALMMFYWRGKRIRTREDVIHDDFGPILLGFVNIVALSTILFLNLSEGHAPKP